MTVQVTQQGRALVSVILIDHFWAGAGTTSAPTVGVYPGQIGANNGGATTANVYHYTGSAWVDTGATVANLYGA